MNKKIENAYNLKGETQHPLIEKASRYIVDKYVSPIPGQTLTKSDLENIRKMSAMDMQIGSNLMKSRNILFGVSIGLIIGTVGTTSCYLYKKYTDSKKKNEGGV